MDDSDLYKTASDEFETSRDESLYIKAQTLADGDESRARFLYIKLRVEQLSQSGQSQDSVQSLASGLINKIKSFDAVQRAVETESSHRNPIQWFLYCLTRYAEFEGRASRAEFWSWIGVGLVLLFLCLMVDAILLTFSSETGLGLFTTLVGLALVLPNFAVTVRRLHDIGRTGYLSLALLLPIVQWILLLYLFWPGQPESNKYGDPMV